MASVRTPIATNPFCAARLRPGAVPYVFEEGESLERILATLAANRWRGQITGPHGAGKSTLLGELARAIESAGRTIALATLHDGQRRLPRELFQSLRMAAGPKIAIVDGFEQLGFWPRIQVRRFCRRHDAGLLVTAHGSIGLPDLHHTSMNARRAWRVASELQRGFPPLVCRGDIEERLAQRAGDLRESLFDLYDLYERRRHA